MVKSWSEDKDLINFLKYLYHHDRNRFNIILSKLTPTHQKEIMKVIKG